MNGDFQQRLQSAQQRRCSFDFVQDYFGLKLATDAALCRDFEFWMGQRRDQKAFEDESVDRWWLEKFLQDRRLMPVKWAALRLGMTQASLVELRQRLEHTGPLLVYHRSDDLIGSSFEDDLFGQFRRRSRPMSLNGEDPLHHNNECRRIHEWIAAELGLAVEPEYCVTSRRVGHDPPYYAKYFDILLLEPVSPVYQVWLDFGKWLTLPPDRCSVYAYALHHAALADHVAGHQSPEVPPEIGALVEEAAH